MPISSYTSEMITAPTRLPDGERIYAVGDVHGCLDLLEELHRLIVLDLAARPVSMPTIIHLGDYIDRGPDSAAVLERLLHPPASLMGVRMVNLRGNHEAMLLAALDGDDYDEEIWLGNGGTAALASWKALSSNWRSAIPAEHIELLRGLPHQHEQEGYLFVHAGIDPDLALGDQNQADLLWIRERFLHFDGELSHIVVHGHTPEADIPVVRKHRIGVDTGAVFGGPLSCVVLEKQLMHFIAVQA
jgi:serine/threonine protein phosphatase 1